jgi:hypothetical protein
MDLHVRAAGLPFAGREEDHVDHLRSGVPPPDILTRLELQGVNPAALDQVGVLTAEVPQLP